MKQCGSVHQHIEVEQVSVNNFDDDGNVLDISDDALQITVKTRESFVGAICVTLDRKTQIALFHQLNNLLFNGVR